MHHAHVSRLAQFIFGTTIREVAADENGVWVTDHTTRRHLPSETIAEIVETPGLVWDRLDIRLVDPREAPIIVRGLRRGNSSALLQYRDVWPFNPAIKTATDEFQQLLNRSTYLNHRTIQRWRDRALQRFHALPVSDEIKRAVTARFPDGESWVADHNIEYVKQQRQRYRTWFDEFGTYPLTQEQQEAILCDEDNCLVVAGAGTGKTSTVVGKVRFLIHTKAARPEHILLLSFARDTVEEINERIGDTGAPGVEIRTFHSLGTAIIRHVEQRKPLVSKLANTRDTALPKALTCWVQEFLEDPGSIAIVARFFASYLYPYRSPFECRTPHDYLQYLDAHDIHTLNGEIVRSYEEMEIANWLFLNGVKYVYEAPYKRDTASYRYRQYTPDFYLPDFNVYIEHFGLNRDLQPAPGIPAARYKADMEWKLQVHKQYGTRLAVTYSHQHETGNLTDELARQLGDFKVKFKPLTGEQLAAELRRQHLIRPLTRLLTTFLRLFKGNQLSLDTLRAAAATRSDRTRLNAFLDLFTLIYERYERELHAHQQIDYDDMIRQATEYVRTGRYHSPFTHVIVDEFQDLSKGRGLLLQALLDQVPDRRLFCVGDDWQSIYRFTGSDVGQMLFFSKEFGYSAERQLTHTHRFNDEILQASSRFIQRNPHQIRKQLRAGTTLNEPAVHTIAKNAGETDAMVLDRVLNQLYDRAPREALRPPNTTATVLLLSRYHQNFEHIPDDATLARRYEGLEFSRKTVHAAKGLEADYVIVLGAIAGQWGFPSEIADDPVLDLVLAGHGYPNAEERRLFYVALTRAKWRTIVMTERLTRSAFVTEIESPEYAAWVSTDGYSDGDRPACPLCHGGTLVERRGHWRCSNDRCHGRGERCEKCRKDAFVRDGAEYRCRTEGCETTARVCPACQRGAMVVKTNKTTGDEFGGCSRWISDGAPCTYTEPIEPDLT